MSASAASPLASSLNIAISSTADSSTAEGTETTPLSSFVLSPANGVVRYLRESDLLALEWHGGVDLRSFYQWQWEEHRKAIRTVLVADFNDFPIGQIAIQWTGKATHPHLPDLQSLRVFNAFRGMRVGSHLIAVAETLIAERGHREVSISVGVDNPSARRLYERLGYIATGTPYVDSWSYTDRHNETVVVEETVQDLIKTLQT